MPIYLERDDPQPRDIEASWRDEDPDLGWIEDRTWTPRRILMVMILLLALLAFLATTMVGVLQFLQPGGPPGVPTPVPLPMI